MQLLLYENSSRGHSCLNYLLQDFMASQSTHSRCMWVNCSLAIIDLNSSLSTCHVKRPTYSIVLCKLVSACIDLAGLSCQNTVRLSRCGLSDPPYAAGYEKAEQNGIYCTFHFSQKHVFTLN